jgi:hypothetical protein
MASVAKADVAFKGGLTSSHIGGDFLRELRGGIRISAGYPVAAIVGRELPDLRDTVRDHLLIAVHQRGAFLGRPIVYGQAGELVREAVVAGGPSGGGVADFLIHRDGRRALHFTAQRLPNRANSGDAKSQPRRMGLHGRESSAGAPRSKLEQECAMLVAFSGGATQKHESS